MLLGGGKYLLLDSIGREGCIRSCDRMKRERARSCCAQVHNSDESINEDFDEISCSVVNKAASADLDIYMYLDNSGVG